jgi:hypothetical protein
MPSKILGIAVLLFFITACAQRPQEEVFERPANAIFRDSCSIWVVKKEMANEAKGLRSVIVNIESEKVSRAGYNEDLYFHMTDKFAASDGITKVSPVFCQVISTGKKNRLSYWLTFETQKIDTIFLYSNSIVTEDVFISNEL